MLFWFNLLLLMIMLMMIYYYYNTLLIFLILFEGLMLLFFLLVMYYLLMNDMNWYICSFFIIFIVCESVLGLTLLIKMVRFKGNSMIKSMDLLL